jgi:hypothetical protein
MQSIAHSAMLPVTLTTTILIILFLIASILVLSNSFIGTREIARLIS